MGHARYIGRIGALAVALGIGAGMFAMPFVASAEPSKPDTSSSTDSASTTSSSTDSASTTSTAPSAKKKPKVPVTKSVNGVIVKDTDANDTTVAITTPGEHSRAVARGAGSRADATNCNRCTATATNGGTATATGGSNNTATATGTGSTATATAGSNNTVTATGDGSVLSLVRRRQHRHRHRSGAAAPRLW